MKRFGNILEIYKINKHSFNQSKKLIENITKTTENTVKIIKTYKHKQIKKQNLY